MNIKKLTVKLSEELDSWVYNFPNNIEKPYRALVKIFQKVKKIIEYIPLLWKDEDWDFAYLLDLIEYKSKRMADCIYSNDYIYSTRDIKIQINELLYHIENYRDSEALTDLLYGKLPFVPKQKRIQNNEKERVLITVREDNKQPLNEEEEELYTQRFYREYETTQSEWHKIWETLDKNCQGWWD